MTNVVHRGEHYEQKLQGEVLDANWRGGGGGGGGGRPIERDVP